jgi:hypothetical protein
MEDPPSNPPLDSARPTKTTLSCSVRPALGSPLIEPVGSVEGAVVHRLVRMRPARATLADAWVPLRNVLIGIACFCTVYGIVIVRHQILGYDSHAYWLEWREGLYAAAPGQKDAFLYSPAFAQSIWPGTLLPWPLFLGIWTLGSGMIFAWLLKPLGWWLGTPAFVLCLPAILIGNITALFALVLVFGFRWPAAWAFPLLAKVTPAVGIVWFLARKEWRSAFIALGVGLGIAGLSLALDAHLWVKWIQLLMSPSSFDDPNRTGHTKQQVPFYPRLMLACVLTVVAARTDRKTLLPLAAALATPVFWAPMSLSVLAANPRLRLQGNARDSHA